VVGALVEDRGEVEGPPSRTDRTGRRVHPLSPYRSPRPT
jgi:hypothetical protein